MALKIPASALLLAALAVLAGCKGSEVKRVADSRPDCLVIPAAQSASVTAPKGTAEAAWDRFRQNHPYPYQAFAGQRLPGGKAMLIMSEPPPDVPRDQAVSFLDELFADRSPETNIRRRMIGSDGYVEDMVTVFDAPDLRSDDLLADTDIRDRIALLHLAWFGTACGGAVETITAPQTAGPVAPNLEVSAAELQQWIEDPDLRWSEIEADAPTLLATGDMTSATKAAAYRSSDDSLVALSLPQAVMDDPNGIVAVRADFRRFAVSSDAVVGAFWSSGGNFVLLGRKRTHALSEIAPLRFETFALLARERSSELSQSYERTHPLAGRMRSGNRDWAPIYLSPQLVDTEFGALLNVTDQMLKSWSEAGKVRYLHFDYPREPKTYVFGATPLSDIARRETGSNEVLFNWNTAGLGVALDSTEGTIFAARRLGALPVTYGANVDGGEIETGNLTKHEDTAYEYFAALGDPNLARVVQYTLIYQAMIAVKGSSTDPLQASLSLDELAVRQSNAMKELIRPVIAMLEQGQIQQGIAEGDFDNLSERERDQVRDEQYQGLAALHELRATLSEDDILSALSNRAALQSLAIRAARGADSDVGGAEVDRLMESNLPDSERAGPARLVDQFARLAHALNMLADYGSVTDGAQHAYESASDRTTSGWIRTPSDVISWGIGRVQMVGGHNLDSRVARFEESTSVSGVEVGTDGVIRYAPSEADRVRANATELARAVEHRGLKNSDELAPILAEARPLRPRTEALALAETGGKRTPAARLGSRTYESSGKFFDELRALKTENPCCRVMASDSTGQSVIAETNAAPPPTLLVTKFGDSVSLGAYIRRGGQPIMAFGEQPAHIESLLISAGRAKAWSFRDLYAQVRGVFRPGRGSGDHYVAADLRGRSSSLMVERRAGARPTADPFTRFANRTVRGARIETIDPQSLSDMFSRIGWNQSTDGVPTGIKISFESGGQPGFFSLLFGAKSPTAAAKVRNVVADTLNQHQEANLLALQMTIKNELRKLPPSDLGRISFYQDRGDVQFTYVTVHDAANV